MFINQVPKFERGNILKKEMLENLRDYPRDFLAQYFAGHSEGIIAGVDLTIEEEYLHIGKGIIKFNDLIYILDDSISIDYSNNNQDTVVKVKFNDRKDKQDFEVYDSEVVLNNDLEIGEDEFELGRFRLRQGARLKDDYDEFEDFNVEYNTLNLINVLYSTPRGATLHPKIIKKFAEILYLNSEEMIDNVFAAQCLNSRVVSRELLLNYIEKKLGSSREDYTNREIYDYLGQILNNLSIASRQKEKGQKEAQKIIVD